MQNPREECSVTAHSCLFFRWKELLGFSVVFLERSEDEILFRIYWARRTGFVFAIELLNRFFKGCVWYSEAQYMTHSAITSVGAYLSLAQQAFYVFMSPFQLNSVGCFSAGRISECLCLSLGLSLPFPSPLTELLLLAPKSPAHNSCSSQGIEIWECAGTAQQSVGMFAVFPCLTKVWVLQAGCVHGMQLSPVSSLIISLISPLLYALQEWCHEPLNTCELLYVVQSMFAPQISSLINLAIRCYLCLSCLLHHRRCTGKFLTCCLTSSCPQIVLPSLEMCIILEIVHCYGCSMGYFNISLWNS